MATGIRVSQPGARIRMRALEPVDVDTLYRWENDPALWDAGSTLAPFSRKQLWDYIDTYDGDIYAARQLRLMIDSAATGDPVGTLDLFDFDPANSRCALGIFIIPEARGEGLGREALDMIASHMHRHLSLHQLYATVGADNEASVRLFASAGFSRVATLTDWIRRGSRYTDAYLYSRILGDGR